MTSRARRDLVQEAFRRALTRWSRLSGMDDPLAWVRRAAWNLATSQWRHARTAALFLRKHRMETVPAPGPERVALADALATWPAQHRRVVMVAGLSSGGLDRPPATAPSTPVPEPSPSMGYFVGEGQSTEPSTKAPAGAITEAALYSATLDLPAWPAGPAIACVRAARSGSTPATPVIFGPNGTVQTQLTEFPVIGGCAESERADERAPHAWSIRCPGAPRTRPRSSTA